MKEKKEAQAKGKVFGKLNIIDFFLILLLVAVVVVVVFKLAGPALANLNSENIEESTEETSALIGGAPASFKANVVFETVRYGYPRQAAEAVAATTGLRLFNSNQYLDAYITDIQIEPCYTVGVDANGKAVNVEDPSLCNLRFCVSGYIDKEVPNIMIGGNMNTVLGTQELRIGKPYIVKTFTIEVGDTIVDKLETFPDVEADDE